MSPGPVPVPGPVSFRRPAVLCCAVLCACVHLPTPTSRQPHQATKRALPRWPRIQAATATASSLPRCAPLDLDDSIPSSTVALCVLTCSSLAWPDAGTRHSSSAANQGVTAVAAGMPAHKQPLIMPLLFFLFLRVPGNAHSQKLALCRSCLDTASHLPNTHAL